jgi:hypothetical protein
MKTKIILILSGLFFLQSIVLLATLQKSHSSSYTGNNKKNSITRSSSTLNTPQTPKKKKEPLLELNNELVKKIEKISSISPKPKQPSHETHLCQNSPRQSTKIQRAKSVDPNPKSPLGRVKNPGHYNKELSPNACIEFMEKKTVKKEQQTFFPLNEIKA